MKRVVINLLMVTYAFFLIACENNANKKEQVMEEKDTIVSSEKLVETIFSSDKVRPGNMAITSDGRMFVTMNPLVSPETKVFEINGKQGKSVAYPNAEYATGEQAIIKAIIGILKLIVSFKM